MYQWSSSGGTGFLGVVVCDEAHCAQIASTLAETFSLPITEVHLDTAAVVLVNNLALQAPWINSLGAARTLFVVSSIQFPQLCAQAPDFMSRAHVFFFDAIDNSM
jgi:hypothetical protein